MGDILRNSSPTLIFSFDSKNGLFRFLLSVFEYDSLFSLFISYWNVFAKSYWLIWVANYLVVSNGLYSKLVGL